MRYFALATDYDGTLAHDGQVSPEVLKALERLRASGRRTLLVTGREVPELKTVFPRLDLFDLVVAENGALLYYPSDQKEVLLAEAPPERFVQELRASGVTPLSVGRSIVATWESQAPKVLAAIQALGLELQVIFNKGSLMVLPTGTNKATGLACALTALGLSAHNVAGIGDAENDHAFLSACECSAAVANALPALKERADLVTQGARGEGVIELIDALLGDDLAGMAGRLRRRDVLLGKDESGAELRFPVFGANLLVAGTSGAGKSTLTTGIIERLIEANYQVCVIDPEGDYQELGDAVILGDAKNAPTPEAALKVLEKPERSLVLNLVGIHLEDRASFFQSLLGQLQGLRAIGGRPHWIIVDEAHHVLPGDRHTPSLVLPVGLLNTMMITLTPGHVSQAAVGMTDALIALGTEPQTALEEWVAITGYSAERPEPGELKRGRAMLWRREFGGPPVEFEVAPCRAERVRHSRKYATGELPPDLSFYFRGPGDKLNLRAQNLITFLQMADGVDDETWTHHLRSGDYSKWFRGRIKSDELADEAEGIESDVSLSSRESRERIREAIERRFTMPA